MKLIIKENIIDPEATDEIVSIWFLWLNKYQINSPIAIVAEPKYARIVFWNRLIFCKMDTNINPAIVEQ